MQRQLTIDDHKGREGGRPSKYTYTVVVKVIHFGHQEETGEMGGDVGGVGGQEDDAERTPHVDQHLRDEDDKELEKEGTNKQRRCSPCWATTWAP